MTARIPPSLPVYLALALALFTLILGESLLAAAKSKPGKGATVYIIRGGGGYFPNLGKIVNEHFETQGLAVTDYRSDQSGYALQQILAAYRAGKLPHGIFLVGYSAGGTASIRIAESLRSAKVPVRLLVLIEAVRSDFLIPSNVKGCFNLYHQPALIGGPVSAASAKTKVVNCDAHRDAGFGREYSHFTIPWVDGVHELIAGEIVNAVQRRPLGQVAPQRLRLNTAKAANSPRPGTSPTTRQKPEKAKSGWLSRLLHGKKGETRYLEGAPSNTGARSQMRGF